MIARDIFQDFYFTGYNRLRTRENANSESRQTMLTLELFAFGRLEHYDGFQEQLLPLSPRELAKLKQLTLLDYAADKVSIGYDKLKPLLGFSTNVELEHFLYLINETLVQLKVDAIAQLVEIETITPREVLVEGDNTIPLELFSKEDVNSTRGLIKKLDSFKKDRILKVNESLQRQLKEVDQHGINSAS
ncbi:BA75_02170T0 [Komagataella pastoris]|uniref:BA75_02170T0 n=1 Tax=Komagataella pastoris TaxID=4922 RepID=A0A1B2JDW6_PICPA|nr:BA75_02170T0 [Komagataella pastoris]